MTHDSNSNVSNHKQPINCPTTKQHKTTTPTRPTHLLFCCRLRCCRLHFANLKFCDHTIQSHIDHTTVWPVTVCLFFLTFTIHNSQNAHFIEFYLSSPALSFVDCFVVAGRCTSWWWAWCRTCRKGQEVVHAKWHRSCGTIGRHWPWQGGAALLPTVKDHICHL